MPVADPRGRCEGHAPLSGPNIIHFHAVFVKNWSNSKLPPPPRPHQGLATPWEILDPQLLANNEVRILHKLNVIVFLIQK